MHLLLFVSYPALGCNDDLSLTTDNSIYQTVTQNPDITLSASMFIEEEEEQEAKQVF